jgi:hypothetical protein
MSSEYTAGLDVAEVKRLVESAERRGVSELQVVVGLNPPPILSLRVGGGGYGGGSMDVNLEPTVEAGNDAS